MKNIKKSLLILACVVLLAGCNKDVKLANGENAIVTLKDGAISSDEYYKELKKANSAQVLMNMIDKKLLDSLYESDSNEKQYIKQQVKQVEEAAKSAGTTLEVYLNYYYGLTSKDAFEEYLSLSYKRDLWTNDYAKETVTEKQIQEYYENMVVGDIEASHILISVDVESDANDEEKTKAQNDALEKAKAIIEKLNNGEDFSKLAKENSKDEATAENGGSLGKINSDDVVSEVFDSLKSMSDGSYSKEPVKSTYGYHILYKKSQDEKPELDDEEKKIITDKIADEIADESGFYIKALKALREKNEMKIVDGDLEKAFEELMSQYEAQ